MNLRCKAGDLCIITQSQAGNTGKMVTCVKFVGPHPKMDGGDYWEIDRHLPVINLFGEFRGTQNFARDSCLMPIGNKDNELVDTKETENVE